MPVDMDKVVAGFVQESEKKRKRQAEQDKNYNLKHWHPEVQEEPVVPKQETSHVQSIPEENVIPVSEIGKTLVQEEVVVPKKEEKQVAAKSFDYTPVQAQKKAEEAKKEVAMKESMSKVEHVVTSQSDASENHSETVQTTSSVPEQTVTEQLVKKTVPSVAEGVPPRVYARDIFQEDVGFEPEEEQYRLSPLECMQSALQDNIQKLKVQQKDAEKFQKRTGRLPDGYQKTEPGANGALMKAQMSRLKDIPRVILERMNVEFKGKPKSQTDALVAWIVCHGDEAMIREVAPYLTDSQQQLVAQWEKTPQIAMQQEIRDLTRRVQQLAVHLDTVELLSAYSVIDRLGFRSTQPRDPSQIEYMEDGVMDAILKAEEQTREMRYERQRQTGRRKK